MISVNFFQKCCKNRPYLFSKSISEFVTRRVGRVALTSCRGLTPRHSIRLLLIILWRLPVWLAHTIRIHLWWQTVLARHIVVLLHAVDWLANHGILRTALSWCCLSYNGDLHSASSCNHIVVTAILVTPRSPSQTRDDAGNAYVKVNAAENRAENGSNRTARCRPKSAAARITAGTACRRHVLVLFWREVDSTIRLACPI